MSDQAYPRTLSHDEEAAELHRILTSVRANRGAVGRLSEGLNLAESTVRDYLVGRIKHSSGFVGACLLATDGDPEIAEMLTPPGYRLRRVPERLQSLKCFEYEMGDVDEQVGRLRIALRKALEDDDINPREATTLFRHIDRQIGELEDLRTLITDALNRGGRVSACEQ